MRPHTGKFGAMARLVKMRGRPALMAVRLAAIAGLALLAASGSVGLTPGTARTAPGSAPRPAPAAFGASAAPRSGCGTPTAAGTRTLAPVLAGPPREGRGPAPRGAPPGGPGPRLPDPPGTATAAGQRGT